jgi:hypothetical protein
MSTVEHDFKVGDKVSFATTTKKGSNYHITSRDGVIESIDCEAAQLVYRKKVFTRPIANIRKVSEPNVLTEIFKGYY